MCTGTHTGPCTRIRRRVAVVCRTVHTCACPPPTHTRTHMHSLTSTPAGTHLCGPELQHQGAGLHLLRHAQLLQVQQVTLQPFAPVGPAGQPGWGQQLPQATFDLAHLVLIPCRDGAQRMGGYSSTSSPGPPCPALPAEAKGLQVTPGGGWGVPAGGSSRGPGPEMRAWSRGGAPPASVK